MKTQAVILDYVNKTVSYVSVGKVASKVKPKAGTTFSAEPSVPPSK
ncbi:MAG: hypothetical protein ACXVRK_13350 [Gaiellaceae bacterium]